MLLFPQKILTLNLITAVLFQISIQHCPEEVTSSGIRVTWYQSLPGNYIRSNPLCINNDTVITRNCSNDVWTPALSELLSCSASDEYLDPSSCPPGFKSISAKSTEYCYQIEDPLPWDWPCLKSGAATVITELSRDELRFLFDSLNSSNYKYFWLPGQRQNTFTPVIWMTPGPKWGKIVDTDKGLRLSPSIYKNCLLLDVQQKTLITDTCTQEYPSLCFYRNDYHLASECPANYHSFLYMLDKGRCFGIEKSDSRLTFQEFLRSKCQTPMGNGRCGGLGRHIYRKIAETDGIPDDTWCWFAEYMDDHNFRVDEHNNRSYGISSTPPAFVNVINKNGLIALMTSNSRLSCMACETNMVYQKTELEFEYDEETRQLYLTVYFPSGLWKYNTNDKGIQCFSDADGYNRVIDVIPLTDWVNYESFKSQGENEVEKYVINLVTERSARYWCEGFTKRFMMISTKKIIVNPQGNQVHVFTLVLNSKGVTSELTGFELAQNITSIFKAKKVLVMDILEHSLELMKVLIHIHMPVNYTNEDESSNILKSFEYLKSKADIEFPNYNYKLVNLSSAVYCLPTTSVDSITFIWDMTPIGHIASPLQFCLQANGLPVNRQCHGSYRLGSYWGKVEGHCDIGYSPTNTTIFLFNSLKGNTSTFSRFLTTGLKYVFRDLNILIPADIYYLSLSFQNILHFAKKNISAIETGDISNIAWVMDRMMSINNSSLRLAQTLNSTNAILEATNSIIELITANNITDKNNTVQNPYKLVVQPRFSVQVSYPCINNITGIAVIRNENSDNFTDMIIKPLYKNTTYESIFSMINLEVATWLPSYIVDELQKNNNETSIYSTCNNSMMLVIKVYTDNAIFQELSENKHLVNSRIVEVTIPGYNTNLKYPIPLFFRGISNERFPKACGYWDFETEKGNIPGYWSRRGCHLRFNIENITVCECYHMTHFGQLLLIRNTNSFEEYQIDKYHEKALNIITLIGSFLSLLGIVGIWVTAIVFDKWRRKTSTKVLLQLTISIALPLILIVIFNLDNSIIIEHQGWHVVTSNMVPVCVSLGALFHYSVLANFIWMLMTAILQFIRYVRVLGVSRPSRFMIKLAFMGWGLPSIPVIAVLLIDYENYIPTPSYSRAICYPKGIYMIVGIIVPVCIVLLTNIVLFLLVIKSISKSTDMQATDKNLIFAQFRLSIFLFFLLGLTWIFGLASFTGNMIWSYLFCLTATVQGLVLFIYFIICDPNTRNMWISIMKPQFVRSRTSVTTISNG